MMKPLWAAVGALALLGGWLGLIAHESAGDPPRMIGALADSAARCQLAGLAAWGYLEAARWIVGDLERARVDRKSARGEEALERVVAYRCAAARTLQAGGYLAAAERVALEAARAQYDNPTARALLLEVRSRGPAAEALAARRELLGLLLDDERPEVLYALGMALAATAAPAEAEGFLRRALALDADFGPAYLALAELARGRGDVVTAREWLAGAGRVTLGPVDTRRCLELAGALGADPWAGVWAWFSQHGTSVLLAALYAVFLALPALWRVGYGLFSGLAQLSGVCA